MEPFPVQPVTLTLKREHFALKAVHLAPVEAQKEPIVKKEQRRCPRELSKAEIDDQHRVLARLQQVERGLPDRGARG